jgi:aspartate ammonia-lyase
VFRRPVAKEAYTSNRTLGKVVLARGLLEAAALDRLLDPAVMTRPGFTGGRGGD